MKEKRYYLVNIESLYDLVETQEDFDAIPNEKFMAMAEKQGTVYSEKGFVEAFNTDEIYSPTMLLKIL